MAPGSPAARDWDRFEAIYIEMIVRMARSMHLSPEETSELINDVWVHLLKYLNRYKPTDKPRSFRNWLYTIVVQRAADLFRRKKRRPSESLTLFLEHGEEPIAPGPEPAEIYERSLLNQLIASVLDILRESDPDIRLVEMRILQGKSTEAISQATGVPASQVRWRASRSLDRLRKTVRYFLGENAPEGK